jgi:transposase
VVLSRCQGDLSRVRRLGAKRFLAAVRAELPRWGAHIPRLRIVTAVFDALADPTGVATHRPGALQRAALLMHDWHATRTGTALAEVEALMVAVLDELDLTDLVCSIQGISAVGAAAILAETGDLDRFASPRAVVKHAGLCPRDNSSGHHQGKTTISGRGRPGLRLAAWRAVWTAMHNNSVLKGRFAYLTTRTDNKLAPQQARAACAAALLRWLHVIVTRRMRWNPAIAAGGAAAGANHAA